MRSNKNRPKNSPEDRVDSKSPKRRLPLWQAFVLPVVSILIFFLLLEGGLFLLGVKPALKTDDPFVGFAGNVPLFVPRVGPDGTQWMVTADNKLNNFNQQGFPAQKAAGTYRVFCLGGSTTYGRPYNDITSFPGWLRELLPVADRSKNWEVINAGGVSYASYRVAHLMEELIDYQPDLFVIYTGHNEFLEERTYRQIREIPSVVRSTVALLAKTRTWATMHNALEKVGLTPKSEPKERDRLAVEVNAILDHSAGLDRYTRDDPLRDKILEHYQISLERMVALAQSVGAEVVFVTPASSLNDCSPFKSEHTEGLSNEERLRTERLLEQAQGAIQKKNWTEALKNLDTAVAIDPRHAELQYLRGQTLLSLKRYNDAKNSLQLARDEDVCPLRALTPMRGIVAQVAADEGVKLVDYVGLLEKEMLKIKGYDIPGAEFFLDHVHPTIEGHQVLAVSIVEAMADMGVVDPGPDWNAASIEKVARTINGRTDREAHGQALANLGRVLLWAGKLDEAARVAIQAQELAGQYLQVAVDSASVLTSVYTNSGQPERALPYLYSAIEHAPGAVELRLKLGTLLLDPPFQRLEESAANLLLVCQQMPQFSESHAMLGLAMAKRGRFRDAYPILLHALRLNPKNVTAQRTLNQIQSMLQKQPNPQPPFIWLDVYPSVAPRKLVQLRRDPSGRNIPDGMEVEFYENGRIKRFVDYTKGVMDGEELVWDRDGKLISRTLYQAGKALQAQ